MEAAPASPAVARFNIGPPSVASAAGDDLEGEPVPPDAVDAGSDLARSTSLQQILASICVERRASSASSASAASGCRPTPPPRTKFWSNLLLQNFLEEDGGCGAAPSGEEFKDDLVFYVRRRPQQPLAASGSAAAGRQAESTVEVHRKHHHKHRLILADPLVDVEESVYLNLIMQHFAYTVTCAVCTRTGARELQILRRFTARVFASPSRHCMDGKASREELTYPSIFFSVHNYEELFADCVIRDSELLCVELVACDRHGRLQGVLFLGSIRYEAVLEVYQARTGASGGGGSRSGGGRFSAYQPSTWFRSSSSTASGGGGVGSLAAGGGGRRRVEFLRMRGPHGKGHAEVAVSRAPEEDATGGDVADNDDDYEGEGNDAECAADRSPRSRRLSGNPAAAAAHGGGGMKKSRSDSENIDFVGRYRRRQSQRQQRCHRLQERGGEVEARGIEEELRDDGAAASAEAGAEAVCAGGESGGGDSGGDGGASGIWQVSRSFGQAWHWFKERRRANSLSLGACLTYVSLPWHRIVADLLDTRQQPVLAYDLPL